MQSADEEGATQGMQVGEMMFLAGGALALLLLARTCFSMCAAIVSPETDDKPVSVPGQCAPVMAAKLLGPTDLESGERALKSKKPGRAKAGGKRALNSTSKPASSKSLGEPLQPLVVKLNGSQRLPADCASP